MKNLAIKILISIALFLIISVKSQILLNNNSCFPIYLEQDSMINDSPSYYNKNSFIIDNKTNKNYIINVRGFMGFGKVYKNGEILNSYLVMPISEPADWEAEDCRKNILVIPAKKSIKTILYPSIFRGWYKITDAADYVVDFETEHTKQSPYYYGCRKYVDSLVNKGYKIYEGTLKGRVKLVQKN